MISSQDTDVTPFGTGAYASRQTYIGGFSIIQTGKALRERILNIAHEQTRMPVSNLDLVDGQIIRKSDGRVLKSLGELSTESLYSLESSQHITAETTAQIKTNAYSFGCSFAEVEVDIPMFSLPGSGASDSLEQQVYLATFDTIRHIALQGPCVIIGRCADYALEDFPSKLRLFISAPLEQRIETVMTRENLPKEKAKAMIVKTDKRRASYYEYYSFQKWGNVESYDFIMDSSFFGYDGTADLIEKIVAQKEAQ